MGPARSLAAVATAAMLYGTVAISAPMRQLFDVRVPMRDGVKLSADVWLPEGNGRYPIVLMRTPYLKTDRTFHNWPKIAERYVQHGFAVVVQDVRGRGDSDGEFDFFFQEGVDGYDTVEWLATQPWSNGKIGMVGASYLGTVQWLAAREKPPHLTCIFPQASAGRWLDEIPALGGAWQIGWALGWVNGTSGRTQQNPNAVLINREALYRHRPLLTMDTAFGREMRLYREFIQHPTLDAYWKRIHFTEEDFRRIEIPALTVTGWFDTDQAGALFYWRGMRKHSPARDRQPLLIGAWAHSETRTGGTPRIGQIERGANSVMDVDALALSWFGHCLTDTAQPFNFPSARVFVTGENVWRDLDDYPPAQVQHRSLHLHSGGHANTLNGDGRLDWAQPKEEPPDRYLYDPKNPVPSAQAGAGADQRVVQLRRDVLVYTTEALKAPLQVLGPVSVVLHAATDARDTDFTAKIMDVYPDGRAVRLGRTVGIIRARYRQGLEREVLLTPNRPEEYRIGLDDIGHTFLPGHQIRIEISSSAYPAFAPNQNTGHPVATDTEWKTANQTIYHDAARPSHVLLPVIPPGRESIAKGQGAMSAPPESSDVGVWRR
jgi:putative CocE/NonD family hydrolase